MAELSADTEAIIDRLKKEGELLRNSGSNSIRSVKVELAKFENIFNTISTSIASQTEAVRAGIGAQADIAERQAEQAARDRAFADLESNQESEELKALREKVETEKLRNELKSERDKNAGPGFFKSLMGMGTMRNLMIGAGTLAALSVGYGFLDEKTEGGLNKMVTSIKTTAWDKISSSLNLIAQKTPLILSQIEQAFTRENLEAMAEKAGAAAAAALGLGAAAKLAGPALDAATTAYLLNEVRKARRGPGGVPPVDGPDNRTPANRGGRLGRIPIRPGTPFQMALGAVGALAFPAIFNAMEETMRDEAGQLKPETLKKAPITGGQFATDVATGASLGLMFGPKGALVGAVAGMIFAGGRAAVNYFNDEARDMGTITNRMEDILESNNEAHQEYNDALAKRADLEKDLTEAQLEALGLGNAQLEQMKRDAEARAEELRIEARNAAVTSAIELDEKIQAEIDKEFRGQRQQRGRTLGESDEAYARAKAEFEAERQAEIDRLLSQRRLGMELAAQRGVDLEYLEREIDNRQAGFEDLVSKTPQMVAAETVAAMSGVQRNYLDGIIERTTDAATTNQQPMIFRAGDNITPVQNTIIEGNRNVSSSALVEIANGNGNSGTPAFGQ
jgi:hypothetical protein